MAIAVVLGHRFEDLDIERQVLTGVSVVDGRLMDEHALGVTLMQADALLVGTQVSIDAEIIDQLKNCRVIVRYGIGADNVDLSHATLKGIPVAIVPDYCLDEVSDHTLALLLLVNRQLDRAREAAKQGQWGTAAVRELRRLKTQMLGIVGYGKIGRLVAIKARAFGMQVIVNDPYITEDDAKVDGVELSTLENLLERCDYVSLHCPLTNDTRHLINKDRLARMKPDAWLINTSRGELVDSIALAEALNANLLAGAALDVLSREPAPSDDPLLHHPKVIITPHVAWYSQESVKDLRLKAAELVAEALAGRWSHSIVNNITQSVVRMKAIP